MQHTAIFYFARALALIGLASCSASNHASNVTNGGATVDNATLAKLSLTSDALQNGGPIPAQFTCDGANQSPAVRWGEPPPGTKSFVLVVHDPDAPGGTFRHWGAFDIPANLRSLGTGAGNSAAGAFGQAVNDMGKTGYSGPCPPKGHGPHRYQFELFALDVAKLEVRANANIEKVESAAERHALARGELIGTYERK